MDQNFSTYREIVYSIIDKIKLISRDKTLEEDHVIFEINSVRALLLKQKYSDARKIIDNSNYQNLPLDVSPTTRINNNIVTLKSSIVCPELLSLYNNPYFLANNSLLALMHTHYVNSYDFVYTGYNRWLMNVTYFTILADNKLYLKSPNSQLIHLDKVELIGIFENPIQVERIKNPELPTNTVDKLDYTFPLEAGLITQLVDIVTKNLTGAMYAPEDKINNGNDEMSEIQQTKR